MTFFLSSRIRFYSKLLFFGLIVSFVVWGCVSGVVYPKQVLSNVETTSKTIYSDQEKIFNTLTAGRPTLSEELKRLFKLKGSQKFNQAIPAIVKEIKRLRVLYIQFEGAEKDWPLEPVNRGVVVMTLRNAKNLYGAAIKASNNRLAIVNALIAGRPTIPGELRRLFQNRLAGSLKRNYRARFNFIVKEIKRLRVLYIKFGGNGDDWIPEPIVRNTVLFTLENAQDKLKPLQKIYSKAESIFNALTIDAPFINTKLQQLFNLEGLKKFNQATPAIVNEIKRLRILYIKFGGSEDDWILEPIVRNTVLFTLKNAQDKLNEIKTTYAERVRVFNALTTGNPNPSFKNQSTKITLNSNWKLKTLNIHITKIIEAITRLEPLYRQYSGVTKDTNSDKWLAKTVNTDDTLGNDYLTLKAAQTAVTTAKAIYDERANVFKALIASKPTSPFEGGSPIIVVRDKSWDLNQLNTHITKIIEEITRLEPLYRQYSGITKDINSDKWLAKTVNTDDTLGNDYLTLKAAQTAVTTAKAIYDERANVFYSLISGMPDSNFEDEDTIIARDDTWDLNQLNTHITKITVEIIRLESLYRQYSGIIKNALADKWPIKTVNTVGTSENDYPTLKAAQNVVKTAKVNYSKWVKVFNALTVSKPKSPFEDESTTVRREKNWNLIELNKAILNITTEIDRLEDRYRQYSGITKGAKNDKWLVKTVNTDIDPVAPPDFPTLKAAQTAVTLAKKFYDIRAKIFSALIDGISSKSFTDKTTISLNKNWKLKELNEVILDKVNEIKRLRKSYIKLGGVASEWPIEPVVSRTVLVTLKNAQDKLNNIQSTREKRVNVFQTLISGGPVRTFESRTTTIKLNKDWTLNQLNTHITKITDEISNLRVLYIKHGGTDNSWPLTSVSGDNVLFTLKKAQDGLRGIRATYATRVKVFNSLTADKPLQKFKNKKTEITLNKNWKLNQLNNAITTITDEINRLRNFYIKVGGAENAWTLETVTGDKVRLTLKNAQDKLKNIQLTYNKRANVFDALVANNPTSPFKGQAPTIDRVNAWNLNQLNNAIIDVITEITRLETLYRQYSGITKNAEGDKWLVKTVNTDGTPGNDYLTLKAAQNAVTTAKAIYDERANVFQALIIGGPRAYFETKSTTIVRKDNWNLNQLNIHITKIIDEITRLRNFYINLGGIIKAWTPVFIVGDIVYFTLKNAQDKLNNIQSTYNKRANVFDALVANNPTSPFKGRAPTIDRVNAWNLNQLNNAIIDVITEITRLETLYRQYSGITKNAEGDKWLVKTVNTDGTPGNDYLTLKNAQEAVTAAETAYNERVNVFQALIIGGPRAYFETKSTTIVRKDNWNLNQLNIHITKIIDEINRLRNFYTKLEEESVWPAEPVIGNIVYFTLKKAQDKLSSSQTIYNKRVNIFQTLIADSPASSFKGKDTIIARDDTWDLKQLNTAITAITKEINRLRVLYINLGGSKEDWISKPVNGDNVDFTLKKAQDKLNSFEKTYAHQAKIFKNLTSGNPVRTFKGRTTTITLNETWTLEELNTAIAGIINEITHFRKSYIKLGGEESAWTAKTVEAETVLFTLKNAQDKLNEIKTTYAERVRVFNALTTGNPNLSFKNQSTKITLNKDWTLEQLNKAIILITDEIDRLEDRYRQYSGITSGAKGDQWPKNTVNTDGRLGNNYPTLRTAQDKTTVAKTAYNERVNVFQALIIGGPRAYFKTKSTTIVRKDNWNLNQLNNAIAAIITEIKRLRDFYIKIGKTGNDWILEPVKGNNVRFNLKKAQDKLTGIQSTHEKRVNVFQALIIGGPRAYFENKSTTIVRDQNWTLEELNTAISEIIAEIIRLRNFYIKLEETGKDWPSEIVSGDNVLFTLKKAQEKLKRIQTKYNERVNVFQALTIDDPARIFKSRSTTILLNQGWTLEELNAAISEIIAEITHFRKSYIKLGGEESAWTAKSVVGDVVFFTLKNAQNKLNTIQVIYSNRTNVFDALVAAFPESDFEEKRTDLIRNNAWNLDQLNKAINDIATEITRLEKRYRQYSGITSGAPDDLWPTNTVETDTNDGADFPTLKTAQDAVRIAKAIYDERVRVFNILTAGNPKFFFKGQNTIIERVKSWDLNQLNTHITKITAEITRLKPLYRQYSGITKDAIGDKWSTQTANTGSTSGGNYLTLKVAQDAVKVAEESYNVRVKVFKDLVVNKPTAVSIKNKPIIISWENSWSLIELNKHITAIITEITNLRDLHNKLKQTGSDWPYDPVEGDNVLFTLKKAQVQLRDIRTIYEERVKIFNALIAGGPKSILGDETTITFDNIWTLNQLNNAITAITTEIARLRNSYTKIKEIKSGWPLDPIIGNKVRFTLKNAQDQLNGIQSTYAKQQNRYKALVAGRSEKDIDEDWDSKILNRKISGITKEIRTLRESYIKKKGTQSGWLLKSPDTGDDVVLTLKDAQKKLTNIEAIYDERVEVFDNLISGLPQSNFKDKNTKIDRKKDWNLIELNNAITDIIAEITRLETFYRQYSSIILGTKRDEWSVKIVNTDGVDGSDYLTLKAAQTAVTNAKKTYDKRVNIFDALVDKEPTSPFEGQASTIHRVDTWDLNQLNTHITKITAEITRLKPLYRQYSGTLEQWPDDTVNTNDRPGDDYPTLKAAQTAITTAKKPYKEQANVFDALIIGNPANIFKNITIKVERNNNWDLNQLKTKIAAIITEITRLRNFYIKLEETGKDWPLVPVIENSVHFTLKNAQDKLNNIQSIYDNRIDVFNALVSNNPISPFEGEDTTVGRDDTWTLNQLNHAITAITTEITRLETLYHQYSGIASGAPDDLWPTNTVETDANDGADFPPLKAAQTAVTTAKRPYKEQANVFDALIVGNPANIFKNITIKVERNNNWDLNQLKTKIAAIITEITRLRNFYIKLEETGKDWPLVPVIENSVHFTLKNAQDKLNNIQSIYDNRIDVFNALVTNNPISPFEGEDTTVGRDDTWTLNQLNHAITAITTEITRLETLYHQYSGIASGAPDDLWPTNTVETDANDGADFPPLKAAQTVVTTVEAPYKKQANVFDALVANDPVSPFEGKDTTIARVDTWDLNQLDTHITKITEEITRLEPLYRQYSGITKGTNSDKWPKNTINTKDALTDDYPTLKAAQIAVTTAKMIYDEQAKVFDDLASDEPKSTFTFKKSKKTTNKRTTTIKTTTVRNKNWNLNKLKTQIKDIIKNISVLKKQFEYFGGAEKLWEGSLPKNKPNLAEAQVRIKILEFKNLYGDSPANIVETGPFWKGESILVPRLSIVKNELVSVKEVEDRIEKLNEEMKRIKNIHLLLSGESLKNGETFTKMEEKTSETVGIIKDELVNSNIKSNSESLDEIYDIIKKLPIITKRINKQTKFKLLKVIFFKNTGLDFTNNNENIKWEIIIIIFLGIFSIILIGIVFYFIKWSKKV